MPRAKIFWASTTYGQMLTKTLPGVEFIWNRLGLKEYQSPDDPGHYVVGRKPPPGWHKPWAPPRKYTNVISFYNGFCIEMLSLDRKDLARGGSYDGGSVDEAGLLNREAISQVIFPSNRGSHFSLRGNPEHKKISFYTSMPWKSRGQWVLDYKEKAREQPDLYYWIESTALDNLEVLGQDYIDQQRNELTDLEFRVEIMNEQIIRAENPFYPSLDDEIHLYDPGYNYDQSQKGIMVRGVRSRINPQKPIHISVDLSGWFNCMAIFQSRGMEENLDNALFVKPPLGIQDLVDKFCDQYTTHIVKHVHVWGEPRGHDLNPDGGTYYKKIQERFEHNGWTVTIEAHAGRTTHHEQRKILLDDILGEQIPGLPKLRINEPQAKWVAMAMLTTQTTSDGKKDKSKEKDRLFPQEKAPHITDCVDYYFAQRYMIKNYPMVGQGIY